MANSRARQDYINAWRRAHPERRREWQRQARLRRYRRQYNQQDGLCYWCGCELSDQYTVDHKIPTARGGADAPENRLLACNTCNTTKGSRMDWRPTEVTVVPIYCYW